MSSFFQPNKPQETLANLNTQQDRSEKTQLLESSGFFPKNNPPPESIPAWMDAISKHI